MQNIVELLSQIENKTLVAVFPHPDDETMAAGGLLLAAKKLGWKTVVICLTRGGAGKIHIHANGYSLKEIRERELTKATRILGVDEVILGDFDDGKLRIENGWRKWMMDKLSKVKPGLVVTYDPSGFYGHPDHIVLSREIHKLFVNNTLSYPPLNLRGGRGRFVLLFVAVPKEFRNIWRIPGMEQVAENMVEPTHRLDLGWNWVRKWRAAKAHRSQNLGKDLPIPLWLFMVKYHFEWYHLVSKEFKYSFKFIDYQI